MTWDEISGLARHALTTAGGILAAHGYLESAQVEPIVGAVLVLLGVAWSIWAKRK